LWHILQEQTIDLDSVIEDFVCFNDQRKDNFGLQTSWQQCHSDNMSMALLQWARSITMEQIYPGQEAWPAERC